MTTLEAWISGVLTGALLRHFKEEGAGWEVVDPIVPPMFTVRAPSGITLVVTVKEE